MFALPMTVLWLAVVEEKDPEPFLTPQFVLSHLLQDPGPGQLLCTMSSFGELDFQETSFPFLSAGLIFC